MGAHTLNRTAIGKTILAIALLGALACVAGSQLAPQVPPTTVLIYGALGCAALFGVLLVVVLFEATFRQFILRNGGTDTQWFWFPSEPPGLTALREQQRMQSNNPKEAP